MNIKNTKIIIKDDKNNFADSAKLFDKLDVGLVLIKDNMI